MIIAAPCGKLNGLETNEALQFLGIPYAQAPVGKLRLKPTKKLPPWQGVRECIRLGHAGPQLYVPGLTSLKADETLDEDCLFLNVTTPSVTGKKPVLFWIHGGAFQKGSATLGLEPLAFAKEGFVVVAPNYRIGALGFLDFGAYLGDEYRESGNNGLLDIIQALRWTQENIAAFGGDPDNITIMGQSAGAKIVGTLTIMKKARGLFRKAVLCSGAVQCIRSVYTARKVTDLFMQEAGLTKETAQKILTMPWQEILKAQTNLFAGLNLHTVGPVFDGVNFETDDALELIRRGACRNIDFLMGTNRDEMNLYWHVYKVHDMDEKLAERLFGNRAAVVMREYKKIPHDENFQKNFVHFLTEYIYRSGDVRMAEEAVKAGTRVYVYRLDWDRQSFLACHGSESQFLMGRSPVIKDQDTSPEQAELARKMRGAFVGFMKSGVPAVDGLPSWPTFTTERREMMIFDALCRVERTPEATTADDMPFKVFELD